MGFQPGHHAGTFTEVKGEVATSIKCSKVSVRPRTGETNCYTDMPVSYPRLYNLTDTADMSGGT